MKASDGKNRLTDVADSEQLLRIIQSIPSPKAEPFKMWLARVGAERIDETIDPEQAIDRAFETYLKKGYTKEWIGQRLLNIKIRNNLTEDGAKNELTELSENLENERMLKYCNLSVVGSFISYHVEVNYSLAYLMQTLANMTCEVGPKLGRDVKGVYAAAKASFVLSSGKMDEKLEKIGGMEHPHMPTTYYLISHNDFRSLN